LLERLGLPFDVRAPSVDERLFAAEPARAAALRLAEAKARSIGATETAALVIGSDQVAALGASCLGKPGGHEQALNQLRAMRGRDVVFHTAVALLNTASGALQCADVPTTVRFRELSDRQIARYVERERPYDCAGSAKIEGLGIALVERVESADPTALIGLPLIELVSMLGREGLGAIEPSP
jgi:septum formation protein